MRYAIVRGQIVENVIIWDGTSSYAPPEGTILVPINGAPAAPGYIYSDGKFIAPESPADEPAA